MGPSFQGASALIPGSEHVRMKRNGQDQVFYYEFERREQKYRYGVSIDGCGSGNFSEYGAIAARHFLSREISRLISLDISVEEMPPLLFRGLEDEVKRLLPVYLNTEELCEYVEDYFYFTVFGFIQGPEITVVFYIGDGVAYINGRIEVGMEDKKKKNNRPDYLARTVISEMDPYFFTRKYGRPSDIAENRKYNPKSEFNIIVRPTAEIQRLAVGSDAWHDESQLLHLIWNLEYPEELQERLNAWSGQPFRMAHGGNIHFTDDASIVLIEAISQVEIEELSEVAENRTIDPPE